MANLKGTNGNESIPGTANNDTISPLLGKDTVDGVGGVDELVINYDSIGRNITLSGNNYGDGFFNQIIFYNIEKFNISTGSGADFLQGSSLVDTLTAGAGNDTLFGNGDVDVIDGGLGIDTWRENYSGLSVAVNISLTDILISGVTTTTVRIGTATGSTVHNIEALSLQTGNKNDVISSAPFAYNDNIVTNQGDDSINVGTGGRDYVHGGDGVDLGIFDWSKSTSDITVDPYYDDYADAEGRYVNFDAIERFDLKGGSGNDYLAGDIYNDVLKGNAGNDLLNGVRGSDLIDGGDGIDQWKADYSTATNAISVQLSNVLNTNEIKKGITDGIVKNVERLDLTTGSGNDTISSSSFAYNDSIWTNGGSDTINVGKGGNDYVHGGDGIDLGIFDWSASKTNIKVDPYYDDYSDGEGRYVNFDAIERFNLKGGSGNDYLAGDVYKDTLSGGLGRDTLNSVSDVDSVDGGGGVDLWKADYSASTSDIKIQLSAEINTNAIKSGINGGVAKNIERLELVSGTGDDVISTAPFAYNDDIRTNAGDDTINVGTGGYDYVHGGDGIDLGIFDWSVSTTAITVDPYYDDYSDSEGHYVNFDAIERFNLKGGTGNDYLAGDIYSDTLSGTDGYDTLDGFAGNDLIIGGNGGDTFTTRSGTGQDVIQDFNSSGNEADLVYFAFIPFQNMDFAAIKHNMQQVGTDVVLTLSDTDSITFTGVAIAGFVANNFYW